jgi:hypothetical protein
MARGDGGPERGVSRFSVSRSSTAPPAISRPLTLSPLRRLGAPWSFGFNDVGPFADEAGLAVVDVMSLAELHRNLWPNRPAGWTIDKHYLLCTLSKGG